MESTLFSEKSRMHRLEEASRSVLKTISALFRPSLLSHNFKESKLENTQESQLKINKNSCIYNVGCSPGENRRRRKEMKMGEFSPTPGQL